MVLNCFIWTVHVVVKFYVFKEVAFDCDFSPLNMFINNVAWSDWKTSSSQLSRNLGDCSWGGGQKLSRRDCCSHSLPPSPSIHMLYKIKFSFVFFYVEETYNLILFSNKWSPLITIKKINKPLDFRLNIYFHVWLMLTSLRGVLVWAKRIIDLHNYM